MKELWCWRCEMIVPMLDEAEYGLVMEAMEKGRPFVEAERRRRNLPEEPPIVTPYTTHPELLAMLEMYRMLTGFEETVPGAVGHHRIAIYGPPCPECEKPLRTPAARYCAACGFAQEEVAGDPRPLVDRKPELFTLRETGEANGEVLDEH